MQFRLNVLSELEDRLISDHKRSNITIDTQHPAELV